jgi:serine protease Do
MTPLSQSARSTSARKFVAGLLAGTILAGGALAWAHAGNAQSTSPAGPIAVAAPYHQGFAELAAKVKPAVVNIATSSPAPRAERQRMPEFPPGSPFGEMFRRFFEEQGRAPRHAQGSGFIVDASGVVVTNNHVIDGARDITVTLDDGTSHKAKVLGRDERTDLAVLKIEAGRPLAFVAFGDSDKTRVGDWEIAVGNPFGLGGTVTAGIVSAHDRSLRAGPYNEYLQIDAPINPGNSGGPLFNQSGEVIGIDAAIYSPNGGNVGIGFAIPSNAAKQVVADLRDHGTVERGWLGVQMQPMTPALAKALGRANADGVLVNDVHTDSPAARADLKQGDVIVGFDKATIKTPRDLALAVAGAKAGKAAKVTVWRDGRERSFEVTIGKQPTEPLAANEQDADRSRVGLALAPLSPDARERLDIDEQVKGVLVTQVTPDSRAEESGVQPGDVIVRIGPDAVTSPSEAAARIRAAENDKKEAVPLLVMRDGATYYLALQLAKS